MPSTTVDDNANRQSSQRATEIAIVALATLLVGLRMSARKQRLGYGSDDYLLLTALAFLFALLALGLLMIHYGLGTHARTLEAAQIVAFAKTLVAFECVYVTTIAMTKVSVLLMYRRIFPIPVIRTWTLVLALISIAWAISIIFVSIFQCTPIPRAWNPSLEDIAMLSLPIPQLWKLNTTRVQRLQLCFIFLLGSFVVFTSVYRFTTLFKFSETDVTWTLAEACTWVVVETASGIISACLPTLAPLVQMVTRKLGLSFSTGAKPSSHNVDLVTIGGGGGSGALRSKGQPFHRLDGEWTQNGDLVPQTNYKMTNDVDVSHYKQRDEEAGSQSGDEAPLKGIVKVTDVVWKESRR